MAKKILLIENDPAFAGELSRSLEASGFDVRVTGDGKEGLDLARDWAPEAIVLCVELPGMSGYLVCQKLRKDEVSKAIPLVLTSAEATEETFEKHRTLKARADEYLLKPFDPAGLLQALDRLVGLPEGAGAPLEEEEFVSPDEELVTLEEEAGLEAANGAPDEELPGLDLQSLPEEAAPPSGRDEDEDLRLLDDAFDGLSAPPATEDAAAALDGLELDRPVPGDEVDAASASLPEEDDSAARAELDALESEADDVLGALEDAAGLPPLDPEPPPSRIRGASADALRAAGLALLDEPPPSRGPSPTGGGADPAEVERLDRDLSEVRGALERAQAELAARDRDLEELRSELDGASRRAEEAEEGAERARGEASAASEKARKAESDLRDAKRAAEQARAAEADLAEARRKLSEAERRATAAEAEAKRKAAEAAAAVAATAKAEALERELDELRTELLVARGEADGARGEVEKRTAEIRKRLSEVEAQSSKNEERVVKAYQKIKADEKVREKVRKALAIAQQLLDEGLPAESASEKERRAAAALLPRE